MTLYCGCYAEGQGAVGQESKDPKSIPYPVKHIPVAGGVHAEHVPCETPPQEVRTCPFGHRDRLQASQTLVGVLYAPWAHIGRHTLSATSTAVAYDGRPPHAVQVPALPNPHPWANIPAAQLPWQLDEAQLDCPFQNSVTPIAGHDSHTPRLVAEQPTSRWPTAQPVAIVAQGVHVFPRPSSDSSST